MRTSRFLLAALAVTAGCGPPDADAPPMNSAIENQSGTLDEATVFAHPLEVVCDGPPEELAILGGICGTRTLSLGAWPTDAEYGQGMLIGPVDGPFFMIFAQLPGEPRRGQDIVGDLQYAAFVVRRGNADNTPDTLNQWKVGEPVRSGSVTTYRYAPRTCNPNWYADGAFVWRSTALGFAWVAGQGC